jgi:hypothetical protein
VRKFAKSSETGSSLLAFRLGPALARARDVELRKLNESITYSEAQFAVLKGRANTASEQGRFPIQPSSFRQHCDMRIDLNEAMVWKRASSRFPTVKPRDVPAGDCVEPRVQSLRCHPDAGREESAKAAVSPLTGRRTGAEIASCNRQRATQSSPLARRRQRLQADTSADQGRFARQERHKSSSMGSFYWTNGQMTLCDADNAVASPSSRSRRQGFERAGKDTHDHRETT